MRNGKVFPLRPTVRPCYIASTQWNFSVSTKIIVGTALCIHVVRTKKPTRRRTDGSSIVRTSILRILLFLMQIRHPQQPQCFILFFSIFKLSLLAAIVPYAFPQRDRSYFRLRAGRQTVGTISGNSEKTSFFLSPHFACRPAGPAIHI